MANIGIHFPQAEIPRDTAVIRDFVQAAEEWGFSHINVPDHVLQTRTARAPFPRAEKYTTEYPHHEVMTLLSYMAAITTRIRLKTAVLILPQRQAALVAKQAAQVDMLSNGRFELGVGLGWNTPEYQALDMSFTNRGRRLQEQIEVCRLLWTRQHVDFQGEWHTIEDAGVAPMPVQQPIPVWIGALAPPAVQRAAAIADGWQAMMPAPDEAAAAAIAGFREAVTAAGRDAAEVGVECTIWATGNNPDAWIEEANTWLAAGATQIMFRPQGDYEYVSQAISQFAPRLGDIG